MSAALKRWSPPSPLVGQRVIEKVLRRHTSVQCPEADLVVAVIGRAIVDCLDRESYLRASARRFIAGRHLDEWTGLVGLHPDFVREIAGKGGYLASEEAHWVSVPRTRRAKPGVAVTALEVADA
ncbi:MAG: hypothetical protein DVS81_16495 [Candidatus Accumulibacter meliphilus]|jgi:hypothetical protein|uniref:Uncharacterized protein n=1 Tax=Candidatus Accumulibacter meliphilus TaxID=2211374 RepID=A0A369XH98_9PROT|nr:MAG: hypothetical protein DVS81_16495 [Candidatus Accumulibacter meliphilus]